MQISALSRLTEKDSPVSAAEKCILVYRQELHKASPKLSNNREVNFRLDSIPPSKSILYRHSYNYLLNKYLYFLFMIKEAVSSNHTY